MRGAGWFFVVVAVMALAWLRLPELHWAARVWTVVLLVPLPLLMVVQARMLQQVGELPRREAYISSIGSLWMLALLTLLVARASGYGMADLGFTGVDPSRVITSTAVLTTAGVAVLFLFRYAGFREAPVLRELLPVTRRDRVLFAGVSISAGVCEEIVFRGFLLHALSSATGSVPLALVISSGAFGVVHAYQRPIGALRAALLGALLATPVLLDGSLYSAILAHTAIDLLSGLWLARWLLR